MRERPIRADMPWAFVLLLFVFGLGVVLWYALDPIVGTLVDVTYSFDPSDDAEKGLETTRTVWDLWPVWFAGILAAFGIVEAIRKSGGRRAP